MPAIHIRDVPEEVVEALKRRAAKNDRSLQKELRHILLSIARESPPLDALPPLELHLSSSGTQSDWSRGEIYEDDGR